MEDDARTDADKEMDCAFLDDQYKARKMVMGNTDKVYLEAYLELEQRKQADVDEDQGDQDLDQGDQEVELEDAPADLTDSE